MSNHPFYTAKKMKFILYDGFRRVCKFDEFDNQNCISLAFVKPIEMPLPMITYMDEWVDAIEIKLEKIEKHSEQYADWLLIRMFTYDEFRWVLETAFSTEKINRVSIYGYLYLDDAIAVEEFKIKYGNPEYSTRSNYLRAISDIAQVEFPELHEFLCKDKITLRYPIAAFEKHSYCLAQSSSGKTELKKHIFHELLLHDQPKSQILLEPHMDLSLDIVQLRALWKKGLQNVIYLDPEIIESSNLLLGESSDETYTFSLNPFDTMSGLKDIPFLVEHVSKAFFEIINSEETFQMQSLIEACVETLLIRPNSDVLDLKRFMDNTKNEDLVAYAIDHLKGERLELMKSRFTADPKIQQTKSSIYYRLQSILGKESLVRCLRGRRTVDVQKIMNQGKIIICNFSKAKLGPQGAPMLGKLFLGLLSGYATLRQNQKKADRMKTYVFIDEFQNYVSDSSLEIFSEQRKYQTFFYVSNQQMGQSMSPEIKRAVSGNTALKFMSENDSESIEWFSKQFKKLPVEATFNLPRYSFWFYNKFNKALGSFILRCPSYLVEKSDTYYLKTEELKKAFHYLIHTSGLYRRGDQDVALKSKAPLSLNGENTVLEHSFTS